MNTSGKQGQNTAGFQGQRTGATGKGPDMICKILDKLEHKFGGQRFKDPANDAKNRALNQKLARRIMTIAPKVLKKLPKMLARM
ncbi:hypothetical protein M436DRAFT_82362 [Aureobasidium namibiae CBS 147.97]|uniref:Uncharacterized protein n=1 Tax=Aureobasidium namibiae CBS 147.97 TaxID=1043004 RepID=A0A074WJ33_9PEZI|nr:uncharacterized protein M436DRAFT_82362 [Aureobasidium namibiae CBS 147.97]KEQ73105.1 hypothetical protein M436DRAFT_82362 [Aureobasidium namibiae CBS 147.97]